MLNGRRGLRAPRINQIINYLSNIKSWYLFTDSDLNFLNVNVSWFLSSLTVNWLSFGCGQKTRHQKTSAWLNICPMTFFTVLSILSSNSKKANKRIFPPKCQNVPFNEKHEPADCGASWRAAGKEMKWVSGNNEEITTALLPLWIYEHRALCWC